MRRRSSANWLVSTTLPAHLGGSLLGSADDWVSPRGSNQEFTVWPSRVTSRTPPSTMEPTSRTISSALR